MNATSPKKCWRLKCHTHEVVDQGGQVVARLRISGTGQIQHDAGDGAPIDYSGGSSAFGYHVLYNIGYHRHSEFPVEKIDGELHYFTGRWYGGCTVRTITKT